MYSVFRHFVLSEIRTKEIRKVAVLGGDGNKYIDAAKRAGADVLVTGDLYYHVAHDAEAMGLAVIDPGHNIEKVMIEGVANYMQKACKKARYDVTFIESESSQSHSIYMKNKNRSLQ